MFGVDFFMKAMAALENKSLYVRPLQCSRLRHQISTCLRCSSNCPTGAISWGKSLDIDADKCTGCGICANICPNGVFEANNPNNNTLLKRISSALSNSQQINFVCTKYQQKIGLEADNIVMVPCLGRIDESVLFSCITIGASSISLINAHCRNCEYKSGFEIIMQTTTIAKNILNIFGVDYRIDFSENMSEQAVKIAKTSKSSDSPVERYSRRDFFKAMVKKTKGATLLATSSIIPGPSSPDYEKTEVRRAGLPFYLPSKRRLLLNAMKKLGEPRCSVTINNIPFYLLRINNNCTGCGMCAYFCPTGAIKKAEADGKTVIKFQMSHCTKCDLCRDICHKGAISLIPDINPENLLSDEEITLFESTTETIDLQSSRVQIESIGSIKEQAMPKIDEVR